MPTLKTMKAIALTGLFMIVLFAGFSLTPLSAQDKPASSAISGTWKMKSFGPDGSPALEWKLKIEQQNGKWTATVTLSEESTAPAQNVTATGNKIHFRAPYEGNDYDVDLKLEDEKLVGTWQGNGDSGKLAGERASS